jgi:hypothetical protein
VWGLIFSVQRLIETGLPVVGATRVLRCSHRHPKVRRGTIALEVTRVVDLLITAFEQIIYGPHQPLMRREQRLLVLVGSARVRPGADFKFKRAPEGIAGRHVRCRRRPRPHTRWPTGRLAFKLTTNASRRRAGRSVLRVAGSLRTRAPAGGGLSLGPRRPSPGPCRRGQQTPTRAESAGSGPCLPRQRPAPPGPAMDECRRDRRGTVTGSAPTWSCQVRSVTVPTAHLATWAGPMADHRGLAVRWSCRGEPQAEARPCSRHWHRDERGRV